MSRFNLARPAMMVAGASIVVTSVYCIGIASGVVLYPRMFSVEADHDESDHHDHDDHHDDEVTDQEEHDDHLALTQQAFENLGLRVGTPTFGDYWKTILVPAQVVEIPGKSDLSVSAPVSGIIEDVSVVAGEAFDSNQTLFTIRIVDEALTTAQSKLLGTLARMDVIQEELDRLAPLTATGAVSANRARDLEYELKTLGAEQNTLVQELRGRGLPEQVIDSVQADRMLTSTLAVGAPEFVVQENELVAITAADESLEPRSYSIESLAVYPGKAVSRGEDLCRLAYHAELYIEGRAFDADLEVLNRIADHNWKMRAELDQTPGTHDYHHHEHATDVPLLRIDNYIDHETQTVRFFASLENYVSRLVPDQEGRIFQQWHFRPGQRVHLRLPVEKWVDQITLPADAVVVEGINAYVFLEQQTHDDEAFTEFEQYPVRVLHRDDQTVVLANDGQLGPNQRIALNQAHKLFLAFKMQSEGSGGHHHHHDH